MLAKRLRARPLEIALYASLFIPLGFGMNGLGQALRIARFAHPWQVLTCYGLYLIPSALVVRHRAPGDQYLFGLLALGLLELSGYALGTSIAYDANLLDRLLGPRNFSLAMTVFFAGLLPAGNWAVSRAAGLRDRVRADG